MVLHHGGFPIRKSADIMLICSSPRLIAACHVLHRLLMPRHSPYALVRLNFLYNVSHYTMVLFELSEFLAELSLSRTFVQDYIDSLRMKRLFIRLLHLLFELRFRAFHLAVKLYSLSFGKTNKINYCPLLFVSTQIFLLFDCQRTAESFDSWSVWMDSNHRPRAYQARALAT